MKAVFFLFLTLLKSPVFGFDENDKWQKFAERFEVLERQVMVQDEKIIKQERQLLDQSREITGLKNVVHVQDRTIFELKRLMAGHQQNKQHSDDLLTMKLAAQSRSKKFVIDNYETVAFHATVATTRTNIDINQTLVFESLKLNIGGGYHVSGGIFIAPISGIYIFSTSVTFNNNQDESHVIIMKNGVEIAGAYGNAHGGPHEQGSVTVVMELKVGDEVYVSNQRHNDVIVYGDNLSSFMGCLILQV